jgi:hypothetical protein
MDRRNIFSSVDRHLIHLLQPINSQLTVGQSPRGVRGRPVGGTRWGRRCGTSLVAVAWELWVAVWAGSPSGGGTDIRVVAQDLWAAAAVATVSWAWDEWKLWRRFETWNEKRIDIRHLYSSVKVVSINPVFYLFVGSARSCGWTDEYMRQSKLNQAAHIFIDFRPKPSNITLYSSVSVPMNIIWIYSSVLKNLKTTRNESMFLFWVAAHLC